MRGGPSTAPPFRHDVPTLDLIALVVQGGAVVVLTLWVYDLRQQNAALRKELKGFTDDMRAALRKAKPQ